MKNLVIGIDERNASFSHSAAPFMLPQSFLEIHQRPSLESFDTNSSGSPQVDYQVTFGLGSELSLDVIDVVHKFLQTIWGSKSSLGEYAKCSHCNKIYSTEDFEGPINPGCSLDSMTYPYGDSYREQLRTRYHSTQSYYVMITLQGKLIGIMDCYVESPRYIIEHELNDHYGEIPVDMINAMIASRLQHSPDKMIVFSSMGFDSGHNTMYNVFKVLNIVGHILFMYKIDHLSGVTEVDRNSQLARIYKTIGGESLGIADSLIFKGHIKNTAPHYSSDVLVFQSPANSIQGYLAGGVKEFISKHLRKNK